MMMVLSANLLLLTDGLNSRYCVITNFRKLLHKLCRSFGKAEKSRRTNFCVSCMQSIRKYKNADHNPLCEHNEPVRIVMPSEELKLKFVNWEKIQKSPFVAYVDLKELSVPVNVAKGENIVIIERQVPTSHGPFQWMVEPNLLLPNPFTVVRIVLIH